MGISTPGESVSLERKIESSIFLCIPRDLNILGKSCTTFVIVKIVRNLSRGRSPCQRVNHVKSGVIYFSAFIFSYDTIHVSGTIHTWNRGLTHQASSIMHKSGSASTLGPDGLDLTQAFFKPIQQTASPSPTKRHSKVSVVRVGNVGMAIAQTILTQDLVDELALVDVNADKLRGEMLDLKHAAAFLPRTKIHASVDYTITA